MLSYVVGDATRPVADGHAVIVHCCNNRGGWGAGFVVALSKRWKAPEVSYREWAQTCAPMPFELGQVQLVPVEYGVTVANLIGQDGTGSRVNPHPVRYDAIWTGLSRLAGLLNDYGGPVSLHMPRMGAGLAGGSWPVIAALVDEVFPDTRVRVYDLAPIEGTTYDES